MPEKDLVVEATYKEEVAATVSYALDVKPILDAKCNTTGCHSAGAPNSDLTTYNNVKTHASTYG